MSEQIKIETFLLQNDKTKVEILDNNAIFTQNQLNYPLKFNHYYDSLKQFAEDLQQTILTSQPPDHILYIFFTESSNTPYFITFSQFFSKFFLFTDDFQNVEVQHFPAGKNHFYARIKPFLPTEVRFSVILLNKKQNLQIFEKDLKNTIFGTDRNNFFSQISQINLCFEALYTNENFLINSRKIVSKVQILQNFRLLHGYNQQQLYKKFVENHTFKRVFSVLVNKFRKLQILKFFIKKINQKTPQIALFYCGMHFRLQDFHYVQQLKQNMLIQAKKLQIPLRLGHNQVPQYIDPSALSASQIELYASQITKLSIEKYKIYGKLVPQIIRSLQPFLTAQQPPYHVNLNVYHLIKSHFPSLVGVGIYHSGIQINDIEIAYGGHSYPNETGLYVQSPRKEFNGVTFYKSVFLGTSPLKLIEIYEKILQKIPIWRGDQYELLFRNCHDFTCQMAVELCGVRIPEFVNRAAKIGGKFVRRGEGSGEGLLGVQEAVGWRQE